MSILIRREITRSVLKMDRTSYKEGKLRAEGGGRIEKNGRRPSHHGALVNGAASSTQRRSRRDPSQSRKERGE